MIRCSPSAYGRNESQRLAGGKRRRRIDEFEIEPGARPGKLAIDEFCRRNLQTNIAFFRDMVDPGGHGAKGPGRIFTR